MTESSEPLTVAVLIAELSKLDPATVLYGTNPSAYSGRAKVMTSVTVYVQDCYLSTRDQHAHAVAADPRGRVYNLPEQGWTVSAYPTTFLGIH